MPATHISPTNAPRGLDRIAASCVFSHNVRGRHFSMRKCRAAGQAAHCSVSTAEDKQRNERGRSLIGLHEMPRKKGSLETLVSSGFLVTFSAVEMSEVPPVADEASEFRGSAPLVATNGKQEAAGATVQKVTRSRGAELPRFPAARRRRPPTQKNHPPERVVFRFVTFPARSRPRRGAAAR